MYILPLSSCMNIILPFVSLMLSASFTSFGRFIVPFVKLANAIIPMCVIEALILDLSIVSIYISFIGKPILIGLIVV